VTARASHLIKTIDEVSAFGARYGNRQLASLQRFVVCRRDNRRAVALLALLRQSAAGRAEQRDS
jgi:hypothetical protein